DGREPLATTRWLRRSDGSVDGCAPLQLALDARRSRETDDRRAALIAVGEVRRGVDARGRGHQALGEGAQLVGVEVRVRLRRVRAVAARARDDSRATPSAQQRVNLFVESLSHLKSKHLKRISRRKPAPLRWTFALSQLAP